jgi:excisionase family DNA binding protein
LQKRTKSFPMDPIFLHSTPISDLKAIIIEAVREEIKNITPPPPLQTEYLTRKEVCKLLQVSEVTLLEWTKAGIIKGYRIQSRIRYKRSEVEESLQRIDNIKYRRRNK